MPTHGDLRIWWVPQIPMKSFTANVANLVEAKLLLDTLAEYDLFQLAHNIKPDFANAGGLSIFDETDKHDGPDGSWVDWTNEDGDDIDSLSIDELRTCEPEIGGTLP